MQGNNSSNHSTGPPFKTSHISISTQSAPDEDWDTQSQFRTIFTQINQYFTAYITDTKDPKHNPNVIKALNKAAINFYKSHIRSFEHCKLCPGDDEQTRIGCLQFYVHDVNQNGRLNAFDWHVACEHYYNQHQVIASEEFVKFIMTLWQKLETVIQNNLPTL